MNTKTKELLDKLRFMYADNGAGYNSDYNKTLSEAADLIEELTERVNDLVAEKVSQGVPNNNQWLIRKQQGTKDTFYIEQGTPPDAVLGVYGITKGNK